MADTSPKNFPGVYTTITDNSFQPPQLSRFRPAFIGVASKGPFDTPTTVRSLREFVNQFGQPVSFDVDATGAPDGGTGHYMADALKIVADYTNDMTIVRVGNRYTPYVGATFDCFAGDTTITPSLATANALHALKQQYGDLYVKIEQVGLKSTVNAQLLSNSGSSIVISVPAAADYTAASISYSPKANAAVKAEGVLYAYTYGTKATEYGTITGNKNEWQFTVQNNAGLIQPGWVYKIVADTDPYTETTDEVRVKSVLDNVVLLETTDNSRNGYQALPLQDNYGGSFSNAYLYKVTGSNPFAIVTAKTEGEWGNGSSASTGLFTRVRPGSGPGTKKIEVYLNGAIAETHDNLQSNTTLADNATPNPDYYETRIAASQYFDLKVIDYAAGTHAANTAAPWDPAYYTSAGTNGGGLLSMPVGAINTGNLTSSGTLYATGGQFENGYNGENPSEQDYVGQYDPVNDVYTGIASLKDTANTTANVLAVPLDMSQFSTSVDAGAALMQALAQTAYAINAIAFVDVPPNLKPSEAVDWHNGKGLWIGRPRIDTFNLALYFNWITITDSFTGLQKLVPPTLAALRCAAFTFQREKPWYAWAGENRGFIPEASAVQYERISGDVKETLQGNGNCINPILQIRGSRYNYGDRTMQRADSKLSAAHSVVLVDYILTQLSIMARRFVFDPNDPELLVQIRLAATEVLDKVKNERGLEDYSLVVNSENNTAETRNQRKVIVDFIIIPVDAAEQIWLNATVRESGATLNTPNV